MWAAMESAPAHKEESVLRSTTPSVERMEEHTATLVRLGKEMLSAQGSALANQEESVLRSTTPSVERMEEHTATPVRLERAMLGVRESAPVDQGSAPRSMTLYAPRLGSRPAMSAMQGGGRM